MRQKIFLVVCLFCLIEAVAQEPVYRRFTGKHGLPSSEVYDILQDNEGYLWFATDQGLGRFDGYHFDVFDQQSGLPEMTVFDVVKDPNGTIWVNTFQGHFAWFDGKKMQAYAFNDRLDSLYRTFTGTSTIIKTYYIDKDGTLSFNLQNKSRYEVNARGVLKKVKAVERYPYHELFYVEDGILQQSMSVNEKNFKFLFEKDSLTFTFSLPEFPLKPAKQNIIALFQNNTLVVAVNNMLYEIGMDGKLLKSREFSKTILSLKADQSNKLWVGTFGDGIYAFANMNIDQLDDHFLLNHTVSSIGFDHENGLWITTLSRGVYHIPLVDAKAYTSFSGKDFSAIGKLASEDDSLLYVALSGGRLAKVKKDESISFIDFPDLANDEINSILVDTINKRLLISTIRLLYEVRNGRLHQISYQTKNPTGNRNDKYIGIKDMAIDPLTGNLWLAGFAGLWCISPEKQVIFNSAVNLGFNKRIESIALDRKGNVWMAALDGLYVYDGSSIRALGNRFPLLNSRITCLKCINDSVWIGTKGSGLFVLANDYLAAFTEADGLASNSILSLRMSEEELLIGTNKGLTMMRRNVTDTLRLFHSIDAKNGLFSNEIRSMALFNNKVYLGSPEGLHVYRPRALQKPQNVIPVYITNISISNQPVDLSTSIEVPYSKNNLQFDYFAISYRNQGKQLYRHRLIGLEQQWVINQKTTAQYPFLPAGNYHFVVEVMNSDGSWNEAGAHINIVVLQPLWEKPWFILLVFVSITAIIITLFYWRIRIVKQRNQLIHDINWYRQEALINQMNPHFLFNALNTVQRYILENDKLSSSRYLSKFSILMRKVLDNSQEKEITVKQEVEALQLYLELEAARFKNKFNFSINVDETIDVEMIKIPVFIVQPLVENAIWHGLMNSNRVGELIVSFERHEADGLKITVTDNGVGRKEAALLKTASKKRSLGTNIISKRISLINTQEGTAIKVLYVDLHKPTGEACGTKVFVIFPHYLKNQPS